MDAHEDSFLPTTGSLEHHISTDVVPAAAAREKPPAAIATASAAEGHALATIFGATAKLNSAASKAVATTSRKLESKTNKKKKTVRFSRKR